MKHDQLASWQFFETYGVTSYGCGWTYPLWTSHADAVVVSVVNKRGED